MPFHSSDLNKLAKVLARSFPEYELRMRLASKAEVAAKAQIAGEALEAWRDIVHCAQAAGSLSVLVEAALLEQPGNADLKRYRVEPGGQPTSGSLGHLWVALALLLAGGLAYWQRTSEDISDALMEPILAPALEVMFEDHGRIHDHRVENLTEPERGDAVIDAGADAPLAPDAAQVNLVGEPADTPTEGRCGGSPGSLVGYFYAGGHFDGLVGEPYTMRGDVNVRADYPRKENSWSSGAEIRCVLLRGDVLVLTQHAIEVDGEKVWVPLHAGDLQKR